jgi:hypothetical protein
LNCTPATPTSSLAVAVTETEPCTVEPAAGAVSVTVGAVVSESAVPDASVDGGPLLPAASRAITR